MVLFQISAKICSSGSPFGFHHLSIFSGVPGSLWQSPRFPGNSSISNGLFDFPGGSESEVKDDVIPKETPIPEKDFRLMGKRHMFIQIEFLAGTLKFLIKCVCLGIKMSGKGWIIF